MEVTDADWDKAPERHLKGGCRKRKLVTFAEKYWKSQTSRQKIRFKTIHGKWLVLCTCVTHSEKHSRI